MLRLFGRCSRSTHHIIQQIRGVQPSSTWGIFKDEKKNNEFNESFCNSPICTTASVKLHMKSFSASSCQMFKEDHKTGTLTVWSDLKQLKASPIPALTLGLAGLIPFISAPTYMISTGMFLSDLAFAQTAYGACILSFIGGVRWGFTLYEDNPVQPDWVNLGYSLVPSLIAWCGLLLPSPMSSLSIIGGLAFAAYADMSMFGYPSWFKGLRFLLSMVAILSLWTTFMCGLMLSKPSANDAEANDDAEKHDQKKS